MEECGYFYVTTDSGEIKLLGKIDEKIVEDCNECGEDCGSTCGTFRDSTDEKEE